MELQNSRLKRFRRLLAVAVSYGLVSVVVWWDVWITGHPSSTLTCACGDPAQTVWSMAWMPFALAHGHNPFFSTAIFAPHGINLLDNTSSLFPSLLLTPITALYGPIVSFNVAVTLAPAFSAFCAYLAIKRYVTWSPAAFAGGLLYGFSPFVLENAFFGHLQFAVLFFPPLLLLLLDDLLIRRRWPVYRSGLALGVLIIVQFFTGTEILAIGVLMAALGTVALAIVYPSKVKGALYYCGRAVGLGVGLAVVVLAWPTWFLLLGPQHFVGTQHPGIASAGITARSIVLPGPSGTRTAFGAFTGYFGPQGPSPFYLGIILAGVLLIGLVKLRKLSTVRWMAGLALVATLLTFGAAFSDLPLSYPVWWAPWRLFDQIPLLKDTGPGHISSVALLFVAVLFAIILEHVRKGLKPWWSRFGPTVFKAGSWGTSAAPISLMVAVLALATLAPIAVAIGLPATVQASSPPAWFADHGKALPDGTTLLVYPYPSALNSEALVWQAQSSMHFGMIGGYGFVPGGNGQKLDSGVPNSGYGIFGSLDVGPSDQPALSVRLASAQANLLEGNVSIAVVVPRGSVAQYSYALAFFTALLGIAPQYESGSWVWYNVGQHRTPLVLSYGALLGCAQAGGGAMVPAITVVPACVLSASES